MSVSSSEMQPTGRLDAASSTAKPGAAAIWLLAIRPKTLPAGAVPVLLGTAIAHVAGGVHVPAALAALAGALLIQILANLANDVFDHEKGADTAERLGPLRVTQAGLASSRQMRVAIAMCTTASLLVGVYLVYRGGVPIAVVGLVSILSGIAYTGGPFPLGYHGLGDVFVFVFFGPVAVAGTTFVQTGAVPPLAFVVGAGAGALSTAVLVVNNVRDRRTDEVVGKRTLAVRFGKNAAVAEYAGLVALAYASVVVTRVLFVSSNLVLLPLVTLPVAIALARRLAREEGPSLNSCLARTAGLLLAWGALFAAGLSASGCEVALAHSVR